MWLCILRDYIHFEGIYITLQLPHAPPFYEPLVPRPSCFLTNNLCVCLV